MDVVTKQSVLSRLTGIGGQIKGIRRMLEGDRHGVDVIHPIAAALLEAGAKVFSRYGHIRER